MHETVPGARVSGQVLLNGEDLYGPGVDPVSVRRRVGMVFQKPNPFPTMSRLRQRGRRAPARRRQEEVARSRRRSSGRSARPRCGTRSRTSWTSPGVSLSGGQQQRLCIARALAVEPEVLLMDEPCSALDPIATAKIEELIHELKKDLTIVIVTHNMQQAARVSDCTAFFLLGELVEFGVTKELFTTPRDRKTEDYITGRFG